MISDCTDTSKNQTNAVLQAKNSLKSLNFRLTLSIANGDLPKKLKKSRRKHSSQGVSKGNPEIRPRRNNFSTSLKLEESNHQLMREFYYNLRLHRWRNLLTIHFSSTLRLWPLEEGNSKNLLLGLIHQILHSSTQNQEESRINNNLNEKPGRQDPGRALNKSVRQDGSVAKKKDAKLRQTFLLKRHVTHKTRSVSLPAPMEKNIAK